MLASERVAAPADAAEFFGIEAGAEICRIKRMHELDGEPLSVVISYLPVEYAAALTPAALRKPLHEALWEHFGIAQKHSDRAIHVARADESLARMLQIGLTDPVLHVRSAVRFDDGRPIRWTHNYLREDRYQYVAEAIWQPPRGQSHPPISREQPS
jgi:GntR family transcriptional regulator